MALATYNDLLSSIAGWLNREDLTAIIPDFITLAERRLEDDLRVREIETTQELTATGSSFAAVSLPSDYLEARAVVYTSSTPTSRLTFQTPANFYDTYNTQTAGTPVNYTVVGSQMYFGAVPGSGNKVDLVYYAKPTALSTSNQTNTYLDNFPDAYLHAALLESAPYLGDDPRIQTWQFMYDRAKEGAVQADERSKYNGAALQIQVDVTNP